MCEHITTHVISEEERHTHMQTHTHTHTHTRAHTRMHVAGTGRGLSHGITISIRTGAACKQQTEIERKHTILVLEGRGLERGSDEPKTT